MDKHTYTGKRRVGYTELSDFTDIQGVGHDPIYRRYDSVKSVLTRFIDPQLQHFPAIPDFSIADDHINWYIDDWQETPRKLNSLQGAEAQRYRSILDTTLQHYRRVFESLNGEDLMVMAAVMRYIDEEFVYCADGKVYVLAWGMRPDTRKHVIVGELMHEADYIRRHTVTFNTGAEGRLEFEKFATIELPHGTELGASDLPAVIPSDGLEFVGWTPSPVGVSVDSDMTFDATYRRKPVEVPPVVPPVMPPVEPETPPEPEPPLMYTVTFLTDTYGSAAGDTVIQRPAGYKLKATDVPVITPDKGYKFTGWNVKPEGCTVQGDTTFRALYEKKAGWWKGIWAWLGSCLGIGCLWWLLILLLLLLLGWLLTWLLPGCADGCTRCGREINGIIEGETIVTADGDTIDDNGTVEPIKLEDGRLPDDEAVTAPVIDPDHGRVPVVREPGLPPTIANRLILFIEDDNDNVDALARDFKAAYPGEQYQIIGFDREVKSLVIQVPENERDQIRETINSRIPGHHFIVFDEAIYELNTAVSDVTPMSAYGEVSTSFSLTPGWHLQAVQAQEGWKITRGNPDIVVAVVDDGIDARHRMFEGRIVNAYNVFTRNNRLSTGVGHGTHVAGLAVGSQVDLAKGYSGIAPACKLMPIQVFDNGQCPSSALVSGIMYAIHKGADVVNISVGPVFEGLNALPVESQDEIARTRFKNEQKLWLRVCKLAEAKNTTLVFAAGNNDILSSIPPENRNAASITVGAVDNKLYPTQFTNYGTCTDISAPGVEIYSAAPGNRYVAMEGTSMSAPIVTGTVALMKSLNKSLTVSQINNVLYRTGAQVYGWMPPMVQVAAALQSVRKGDLSPGPQRPIIPVPGYEDGYDGDEPVPDAWVSTPGAGDIADQIGIPPGSGIPVEPTPGNGAVPGNGSYPGTQPGNGVNPNPNPVPGNGSNPGTTPGKGSNPGAQPGNPGAQPGQPATGDETDYEAIRRMIRDYQRRIEDLKKQLPENRK